MPFLPHLPRSARTEDRIIFGVIAAGVLLLLLAIFTSPWVLLAGLILLAAVTLTWKEPLWTVLFLCGWWPLEPFLLKWVSDDLYIYARYFSEVMVYVLVAVVVIGYLSGRFKRRVTAADLPFALFVLMIAVSVLLNTLPIDQAVLGARQILRFILLFWVVVMLYPRRFWVKRLVIVLFAMLLLQSVLGIAQSVTGGALDAFLLPSERHTFGDVQLTEGTVQFWDPGQRVFGTLGRYDRLGTFLALALLLVVGFVYESGRKPDWKYFGLLAILGVPAVILTYSRSAWFGLMLGALALAWVKKDKRAFKAAAVVAILFAAYLGINGLSSSLADVQRQTVSDRFLEAFTYQRFRGEYLGLGRVYWMVKTPTEVVPHSIVTFLFGWGPAQYGAGAVAAIHNTRVYDAVGLPFGVYGSEGYIDNNWFALWGETGTLGIIFYVWGYIALMIVAVRVARHSNISMTRAVASAYVGIATAVAVNALLATFLEVRTLAPYLWILGGCVVVMGSREGILETRVRQWVT